MLRALVGALVLANLLFFVWARGWLVPLAPPPQHGEREPERLAAQVRPQLVQVLTPQAASAAATAAAAVCLEAGPFSDADIGSAESALEAGGVPAGTATRRDVQLPGAWLVYIGRFADAGALRGKQDELRRLKLAFEELRSPAELAPGLVLSRHEGRDAADAALAEFTQRGVRSAKVVPLPPPPLQHFLRVARADAALRAKLQEIRPPGGPAEFGPCAKTP